MYWPTKCNLLFSNILVVALLQITFIIHEKYYLKKNVNKFDKNYFFGQKFIGSSERNLKLISRPVAGGKNLYAARGPLFGKPSLI